MSLSDSQTQIGKERSLETSEVSDPVFSLLKNFADEAKTVVPRSKRRAAADDDSRDGVNVDEEKEEPVEKEGVGDAKKMLPYGEMQQLLKDAFGEIVGCMLDELPEEGKYAFLVKCFREVFPKLSGESQELIRRKVEEAYCHTLKPMPYTMKPLKKKLASVNWSLTSEPVEFNGSDSLKSCCSVGQSLVHEVQPTSDIGDPRDRPDPSP